MNEGVNVMPKKISNPIVVPAKQEIVADTIEVMELHLYSNPSENLRRASATLGFYCFDEDGTTKHYARNADGSLITRTLSIDNLDIAAANDKRLASAMSNILDAATDMYEASVEHSAPVPDPEEQPEQ